MSRDGEDESKATGDDEASASWDDEASAGEMESAAAEWDTTASPPDARGRRDAVDRRGPAVDRREQAVDRGHRPGNRRQGDRHPHDGHDGGSDRWIDTLREQQYDPRYDEPRRPQGMDPGMFDAGVVTFSFRYPSSAGGAAALLTGVLGLLSFLVVPGVLATGYLVRVTGGAARAEEPPGYDDVWGLAKCGIVATALVWGSICGLMVLVYVSASESVLLASVLAVAGAYLVPALFTTYAATEDLRETVARTPEFAFTRTYAFHVVADSVLLVGLLVVGGILFFLVPFGFLLVPLMTLVPAAYWGYVYGEAIDEGLVAPLPSDGG